MLKALRSVMKPSFAKALYFLFGATCAIASVQVEAAIPLADSPLFLQSQVAPNLVITLDDSGSMSRAYVPDLCDYRDKYGNNVAVWDCDGLDHRYIQSSHYNRMFYDPTKRYTAAKDASGAPFSNTTFTAAWRNGFDPRTTATGGLDTVDLSSNYKPTSHLELTSSPQSEEYMKPFVSDLTCNIPQGKSKGVCALSKGDGSWLDTTKACSAASTCQDHATYFGLPAYYYEYVGTGTGCTATDTDIQKAKNDNCYAIRIVSSAIPKIDWNGDGVEDAKDIPGEQQNFANWFSFSRTRNLATQTAASLSLVTLNPEMRVAWQSLNSCNGGTTLPTKSCQGWDKTSVNNAIKPFTGTHKTDFYKWVSHLPTSGGTPLPAAMQRAGEYFTVTTDGGPYDNDLTKAESNPSLLSCRRNYHVMMTDGIWNAQVTVKNVDGTSITLGDNKTKYSPQAPYTDGWQNTLADIAFKYWSNDLAKSLDNTLTQDITVAYDTKDPVEAAKQYWDAQNDPATWQHMVNFTIGLGLSSYFDQLKPTPFTWDPKLGTFGGSYLDLKLGATTWPQPGDDKPENVTDLWHAAINSRGLFFAADSPDELSKAFADAIAATAKATGSSAALSANSTSLKTGALLFQAKFSDNWSGTLLAFNLGERGKVDIKNPAWNAAEKIPAPSDRLILTNDGSKAILFEQCKDLNSTQQALLNKNLAGNTDNFCQGRVDWLRGSTDLAKSKYDVNKNPNAIFRDRATATGTGGVSFTNVMGDIINSDPAYVKNTDFGYSNLATSSDSNLKTAGAAYADFVTKNALRKGMVYVGANDGRMYGIETGETGDTAATNPNMGRERFSYIPAEVYSNLSNLTDQAYSHRYYADGSIQFGDAYFNGAWKTVVVAGMNAGGRAVYALDVTNPDLFDATSATAKSAATAAVLWELSPSKQTNEANYLGYTYSRPQIGVLEDGTWVAVFGNGYNSPNGGAYLYVVELATGKILSRALASDTTGDESNGLSTPVLYDSDNNGLIDTAYAGDLAGTLWKFDLKKANSVPNGKAIFVTAITDATLKTRQPITTKPAIASHPLGSGPLILFGTGRYVTGTDIADTTMQSFYGIWDKPFGTQTDRSNLQAQSFDYQDTDVNNAGIVRSITNNQVNWGDGKRGWYLDLLDSVVDSSGNVTGTTKAGERIIYTAKVQDQAVIFGSVIPSSDPCTPGGSSFLYAVQAATGASLNQIVFDTDDNGVFDNKDVKDTRTEALVGGVSFSNFGLANIATLIQGDQTGTDANVTYAELAGTTDKIYSQGMCLKAGGCGPTPPTPAPPASPVRKRSWIQIR